MHITQIRNATLLVEFAGTRFLIDPMLSPKDTFPAFAGTPNEHLRNPTTDLPMPMDRILDVDAVVVTHIHPDHWDETAAQVIPKDMPILVQNAQDKAVISAAGFTDVRTFAPGIAFGPIDLMRTPGQHGSGEAMAMTDRLGVVSGVIFRHQDEPTLYIAGDTIWNRYVSDTIMTHGPDVIVLNCGEATIHGLGRIIMNANDVLKVCQAAPEATIIASHMEAVNHAVLTRSTLRTVLNTEGITEQVHIPADGETLTL